MDTTTDRTEVKVNLPGGTIKLELEGDTNVRDLLMLAAKRLGVDLTPEHMTAIVDEQEVGLDDMVPDDARDVYAAPNASNG